MARNINTVEGKRTSLSDLTENINVAFERADIVELRGFAEEDDLNETANYLKSTGRYNVKLGISIPDNGKNIRARSYFLNVTRKNQNA
ncbi:hypothetical protein HYT23_04260 [Candidatus Pacearchaeota archaeon]|nr:hypothetical protein [Candidatus Pacearchaeota archaeon]